MPTMWIQRILIVLVFHDSISRRLLINFYYPYHREENVMRGFSFLFVSLGFLFLCANAAIATPVNLAELYGTATQSSTHSGGPELAIDGNTDGNWNHGSVSHTFSDNQAWWQVNLGDSYVIDTIDIWNRTDSCSNRLTDFTVSVLDGYNTVIWSDVFYENGGYPYPNEVIDLFADLDSITGQIIKIQLNGKNFLHLAEVQVWEKEDVPPPAVPEPTTLLLVGCGLIGLAGLRHRKVA